MTQDVGKSTRLQTAGRSLASSSKLSNKLRTVYSRKLLPPVLKATLLLDQLALNWRLIPCRSLSLGLELDFSPASSPFIFSGLCLCDREASRPVMHHPFLLLE